MLDDLKPPGRHPVGHHGGSVNRRVIPVKPPGPGRHRRPLHLQSFQEVSEGLNDVGRIDSPAPGKKIHIDEALGIEKGQDHLFLSRGVDLGLDQAWRAFHKPPLGLLLTFWHVKGHGQLVHSYNIVQHRHRMAANPPQKLHTCPHSLLLHVVTEKLGDPSCSLLRQIEIVMQRGMDGPSRNAMDPREFPHSEIPVALHLGGNISDECRVSNILLWVLKPLWSAASFPSFTFLTVSLISLKTFPGNSESTNEITDRCHCEKWRG
jgi:hypothetical protein